MGKQFIIKQLPESYEVQRSYDQQKYVEALLKCRIYLESWLFEYVFAILHPLKSSATPENRACVKEKFDDMFIQINWLKQYKYITPNDYDGLNEIRIFTDHVLRKNDLFRIQNQREFDRTIENSVNYCYKMMQLTQLTIDKTIKQHNL